MKTLKSEMMEAAKAIEMQQFKINAMGQANMFLLDFDARFEHAANYRLERDILHGMQQRYEKLMARYLERLINEPANE